MLNKVKKILIFLKKFKKSDKKIKTHFNLQCLLSSQCHKICCKIQLIVIILMISNTIIVKIIIDLCQKNNNFYKTVQIINLIYKILPTQST